RILAINRIVKERLRPPSTRRFRPVEPSLASVSAGRVVQGDVYWRQGTYYRIPAEGQQPTGNMIQMPGKDALQVFYWNPVRDLGFLN
ncbi:MAG: hypothetical protein P4L85_02935, partial [Paludisphaera borealis]|uniref:hypothetical protein n=1 Tax=Paludisphaera borealis TaxID=1387353 RepID=UPI0028492E8C